MIRIGIVEDKLLLRENLLNELKNFEHIRTTLVAENGDAFLNKMKSIPVSSRPEIVLMDIDMPIKNGILTVQDGKTLYPEVEFIMLTVFDEDDKIFEAIKSGASGYLLKDENTGSIVDHIEQVHEFQTVPMSPAIARKALRLLSGNVDKQISNSKSDYNLTDREKEVLKLLVEGLYYKEIAHELSVSPNTVRNQITAIYKKLHVSSKVDAVKLAMKNRIV